MKKRISASIDPDLMVEAQRAVDEGLAENVSAWVNAALRRQVEHDRRLRALSAFIASYEKKHGVITDEEIRAAKREVRARAVVVGKRHRRRKARAA